MPFDAPPHATTGHLVFWGAPLWGDAAEKPWPLEDTLVAGLLSAQSNGTHLKVLPFLVLKHHQDLDWAKLKGLARAADMEGELGWLLSLTAQLMGRPENPPQVADLRPHQEMRHFPRTRGRHEAKWRESRGGPLGRAWGLWVDEDPALFEGPIRLHLRGQHLAKA